MKSHFMIADRKVTNTGLFMETIGLQINIGIRWKIFLFKIKMEFGTNFLDTT